MSGRLHRFFVPPSQIKDGRITILNPDARQIRTVLRFKAGDNLAVLDGLGNCYQGRIDEVGKEQVSAIVYEVSALSVEPEVHLALAQGLPKGEKYGLIIQKGTELGVSEFIAVTCARSISKASDNTGKYERWLRIAKEAAEQCGRSKVPVLGGVQSFAQITEKIKEYDLSLIAWEEESNVKISDVLKDNKTAKRVLLFIGPEGGFTKEETEAARQAGAVSVSLGKRILRTETAAIAASTMVLYELEGQL